MAKDVYYKKIDQNSTITDFYKLTYSKDENGEDTVAALHISNETLEIKALPHGAKIQNVYDSDALEFSLLLQRFFNKAGKC